jgi:C1A family cysteine protease
VAAMNLTQVRSRLVEMQDPWEAGENPISRRSPEERRKLLGLIPSADDLELMERASLAPAIEAGATTETHVNWADRGHVTAVRDQGNCGSCVSFACIALLESMSSIKLGLTTDLSEADSHFCSDHGANCGGWWPGQCLDELKGRGVATERQFPYASAWDGAQTPSCRLTDRPRAVSFAREVRTVTDREQGKQYIATTGPLTGCFDVYDDFYYYRSGVYERASETFEGLHCVLVVGFDEPNGCWIVKNSWGTGWGDGGYVRIAYDSLTIDGKLYPMYGVKRVLQPWTVWKSPTAALEHPNGHVYFFRKDRYQRFDLDLGQIDKNDARIGVHGWSGVWTTGIDAALIHPRNGKAYFFRKGRYQRYDLDLGKVDKDDQKIGSAGWWGLKRSGLDAALVHPRNGKAYFFSGDRYQRYDFDLGRVDKTDARIGVDGWKGVWRTGIDAALVHPGNGKAYFFKGDRYQRFDFDAGEVDKDNARVGVDGW